MAYRPDEINGRAQIAVDGEPVALPKFPIKGGRWTPASIALAAYFNAPNWVSLTMASGSLAQTSCHRVRKLGLQSTARGAQCFARYPQ